MEGASGGVAINPQEVDDMAHAIAWIFEALLRLNGHGADMVRPYLVPNEQRSQGCPWAELVCAPHGMVMAR
ncbi:hypothetical protein FGK60_34190 [Streptomyces sp. DASNCL29]|nr:hypothetical protein FGK60_34190 [Streptomyces sp. DASNCL29]